MSTIMLRRILAAALAATAVTVLATMTGGSPAQALSCVAHDTTAQDLVAGQPDGTGRPLLENYDFAITGTVTRVHTDESDGHQHGATEVHFEVINGFGVESIPAELVVSQGDPGWMTGSHFDVGATYFLPLLETGPDGQPNYSFLCDPLFELDQDQAAGLPSHAAADVTVAVPTAEGTTPGGGSDDDPSPDGTATGATAPGSSGFSTGGVLVAGLAAAAVAVVVAAVIVLRRGMGRHRGATMPG